MNENNEILVTYRPLTVMRFRFDFNSMSVFLLLLPSSLLSFSPTTPLLNSLAAEFDRVCFWLFSIYSICNILSTVFYLLPGSLLTLQEVKTV